MTVTEEDILDEVHMWYLDNSSEVALNQILEKKCHEQFLPKGKEIALVGVNFISRSRNIENWKAFLYTASFALIRKIS
ncbi:MAG: hypothetical protein QNJ27_01650 [Simkaniaceae bacterium]|nr:hypothetical protein [Simkaniaceae bacterium]